MLTGQPVQLKQTKKNKTEGNESETAIITSGRQIKEAHPKVNNADQPSATLKNSNSKMQSKNRQQKPLKQAKIQDFKPRKKTQVRPNPSKRIVQNNSSSKDTKKQQKKSVQSSQSSKSSEESSSNHQKIKINKNSKITPKNENVKKSQKSSSSSKSGSESNSSKGNKSEQKKHQTKIIIVKDIKNVEKDSKKIQMTQSTLTKKNETKQKKQKGSDDQSDYAPSLREASKNRKNKQSSKQQKSSSDEQKRAIPMARKKGILKNALPESEDKLNSRSKPQTLNQKSKDVTESKNQEQKNAGPSKQRSLRKKKPVSYRHMDEELSDQEMGQKVPYRGRFKSNIEPIEAEIQPQQQKQKPVEANQAQEKINIEDIEQQKYMINTLDDDNNNDKEVKPKLVPPPNDKKISNNIENPKSKIETSIQHQLSAVQIKSTRVRSRQQYQKSNLNSKRQNNLSLQSRVIVQSVIMRVHPINSSLHLTQLSPSEKQEKIKLFYELFQHAPCCPFPMGGYIRKKKIQEEDEQQSDQQVASQDEKNAAPSNKYIKPKQAITQEEHQNHEEIADFSIKKKLRGAKKLEDIKMQESAAPGTANHKNSKLNQSQGILAEVDKKVAKNKKNNQPESDEESILVKGPTKRLRQKKAK